MTGRRVSYLCLSVLVLSMLVWAGNNRSAYSDQGGYVCPPCGSSCDQRTFDGPGACPVCSMELVKKASMQAAPTTVLSRQAVLAQEKKVAIFIFEGVQIIDFTGPYEVFGQAGLDVFTVGEKAAPITTAMGMSVTPQYTFENHPKPDVLLLPGGDVPAHQDNPAVIRWIQENANRAEVVISVCNGAFFLARAGLLDGLKATTFASLIPGLQQVAPKTKVVSDKRFVDNGKIVTTAGLSSGIDGSLHVVEKLLGKGWAQVVATGLEYNWDPESKFVRAALADQQLRGMNPFIQRFEREVMKHEGGVDRWTTAWKVQTDSNSSFFDSLNNYLATENNWNRQNLNDSTKSLWKFSDPKGQTWTGEAILERVSGEQNRLILTMRISRS